MGKINVHTGIVQRKQAQTLVYIYIAMCVPLLYNLNRGCALECRDAPTSHCVNLVKKFDPYICPSLYNVASLLG